MTTTPTNREASQLPDSSPDGHDPATSPHPPVRVIAVITEAIAAAIAAPVASLLTIAMIAGMCAAVLLTSGRTVGAEQAVVSSIDTEGTRSIIVRADAGSGLDSTVLQRLKDIGGIQWAGAFSAPEDVQNSLFPGNRVPARQTWTTDWHALGMKPLKLPDVAYASPAAIEELGVQGGAGSVTSHNGQTFSIAGETSVPAHLRFLGPVVLLPRRSTSVAPISVLVVLTTRPDLVAPISAALTSVLSVDDPRNVTIETSKNLASLRAVVQGQLGSFGRTLTLAILALTSLLTAAVLFGVVMMRRKDFGRRRALGAPRSLIIALVVLQAAFLSLSGALLGTAAAVAWLIASHDPIPGAGYLIAIPILAIAIGVLASVAPALAAANREPIRELRVA